MGELHTILVVDDEPDVIKSIYDLLRTDYRVVRASSGPEAIEIVQREEVHIVLVDHRMPDLSGTDLLQYLREHHPQIVRILMTAYADDPEVAEETLLDRDYRYLTKPFNPEELKAVLRDACHQYNLGVCEQTLPHDVCVQKLAHAGGTSDPAGQRP